MRSEGTGGSSVVQVICLFWKFLCVDIFSSFSVLQRSSSEEAAVVLKAQNTESLRKEVSG